MAERPWRAVLKAQQAAARLQRELTQGAPVIDSRDEHRVACCQRLSRLQPNATEVAAHMRQEYL